MQFLYPATSLAFLALTLAGCGEANREAEQPAMDAPADEALPAVAGPPPESAADEGSSGPDPAPLVPEAEKGETGARNVLLDFARAIELEEFGKAYAMLGDGDRQGMTRAEFAAMFEGLGEITVAVPSGRMEGAAGSLYYEVPTTITGSGSGKSLTGTTVLRRVNDVPGATAEQLRWHIESFRVEPG